MRVILAGGGTGGHVIPALAIARELQSRYSAECCFIGTQRGIETRLVPAAGFPLQLIEVGALNQVSLTTRMKTMLGLPAAVWSSLRILRDFRPDAMIGVGGYASGPAMLAAALRRVPSVAFEPNVVPGFANRMVAPLVSAAAVHFEDTKKYFRNCHVTGVPVRTEFFQLPQRDPTSPPTLLVFGGSQGAHAVNLAFCGSIASLRQHIPEIQVMHQTGERDFDETVAAYEKLGMPAASKIEVSKFMDNMPAMFARADLVVCRAGASTVAEIAAAGKPAVFVPFPRAADDHQRRNAEAMQNAGAAVIIEERDLTPARLVDTVVELFSDATRLKAMSAAARKMAHPNAAHDIAELAVSLIDRNSKPETRN
jgi:UDP-N-acetylglucosamine--N-acetylmuramyl-(pentapeptide) pyrophosphoryl-undecaprenol N-acetylglucosamine transferase